MGLEKDYPSTVSTIARTCSKLAPKDDKGENCVLCERCVIFFFFIRSMAQVPPCFPDLPNGVYKTGRPGYLFVLLLLRVIPQFIGKL